MMKLTFTTFPCGLMENNGSGVASAWGGSTSPQEAREMCGTLANWAARVTDFAIRSSRCSRVVERRGSEVVLAASAAEDTAITRIAGQIDRSDLKTSFRKTWFYTLLSGE